MRQLLHELKVDSVVVTLDLDLPEIGVRGEAVVTGVEPCPAILSGPGKGVLTTFHHASSNLLDLYVSSQPPTGRASNATGSTATFATVSTRSSTETLLFPTASRSEVIDQAWERIGVTGNHPIWSADRHDYVAAMDLRLGERLNSLAGDTVYVQQKLARPGPAPVYNLEVQDEHVYYVGASGVLAHNAGKNNCKTESAKEYENRVMNSRGAKRDAWFEPENPGEQGPYIRSPDGQRGNVGYEVKHVKGPWKDSPFNPSNSRYHSNNMEHKLVSQMEDYVNHYKDGGIVHYSNSKAMLRRIRALARRNGLTNVRTRFVE